MDSFLKYIDKISKVSNFPKNVHIVLGNESCDLDSTISALLLSYFIQSTISKDNDSISLPIMNINKEEFPIRTESNFVLNRIGVDTDKLFYKDTIKNLLAESHVKITLVDHHVLSKSQEYLKTNVEEIFDHRPIDMNAKWCDNVRINIKLVGSCSTLIAEEIFANNSNIITEKAAKVLYDTIIFDTIGLSSEAGRVQDLDIEMCKKLEEILHLEDPNYKELFAELWAAHNNVSHLTPKQLLSKDLKIVEGILIPGLPMLVIKYLKMTNISETLNEFCNERNFNMLILMGLEAKDGVVERDIAFYSTKANKLFDYIVDKLKDNDELKFVEEISPVEGVKYFRQNHKPSRKQIIPIVKNLIKNLI